MTTYTTRTVTIAGRTLSCTIDGDGAVFAGGVYGTHRIAGGGERIDAHWDGYCAATDLAAAAARGDAAAAAGEAAYTAALGASASQIECERAYETAYDASRESLTLDAEQAYQDAHQ